MPSSDLESWNRYWRLTGGEVYCRNCLAKQSSEVAEREFEHLSTCPYRSEKRTPWDDLRSALLAAGSTW
jgi:hypothetical protein